MRIPKENGLQMLQDIYRKHIPTEFQLTLTFLEATELAPTNEGFVLLALARYGVSLNRSGSALVSFELEDIQERSDVQELIEQLEEVNGEYCYVGEVSKIDRFQFATGLTQPEMIEVSIVLANLLQHMSETVLIKKDRFLALPVAMQFAWLREYAFTEKSKPIRQVEHEGVRWFRFDDPMSWSAW